jgi:hypothetical protein
VSTESGQSRKNPEGKSEYPEDGWQGSRKSEDGSGYGRSYPPNSKTCLMVDRGIVLDYTYAVLSALRSRRSFPIVEDV